MEDPKEDARLLAGRVARLEREVEELRQVVGISRDVDPLAEATALFVAANKAKARAGAKPPGRM